MYVLTAWTLKYLPNSKRASMVTDENTNCRIDSEVIEQMSFLLDWQRKSQKEFLNQR